MNHAERFEGCLLGLAVGDALGMPVEGWSRGKIDPVGDMRGGGPMSRAAGSWTDDTAMALCLAESLLARGGFDPSDQMDRYSRWARAEYLAETGTNLDIGTTVADALARFQRTGDPYAGSEHPQSAGNGCIMRLAPIPMFFSDSVDGAEHWAAQSSRTTHGAQECVDSCRLLSRIIWRALMGSSKQDVLFADGDVFEGCEKVVALAKGGFASKADHEIHGTGYVVQCLEAALWCFAQTESFRDAVLKAANLGDDADTTAAVCGQVSGAYYGVGEIPETWLSQLLLARHLSQTAQGLFEHRAGSV